VNLKTDDIKLMYEYNYWANRLILNQAAQVSEEQYVAPTDFGIGWGSLRGTLVHLLDTERQWRITCEGHYATLLTDAEYDATEIHEEHVPTFAALIEQWAEEQSAMRAYLDTLDDEKLNGILRYVIPGNIVRERALWHCLYHNVNHGMQHRSEAAALLTSYRNSPGDIDFTMFLNEHFKLQQA
jgi:uncharacterized damage-inducible protein DinB